jgi:hypothetical protein
MRGFMILGLGAFAAGAAVAVVQQQRSGADEDYGEDPNWPSVPYTRETHPDSPQEQVTVPVEQAPSSPMTESEAGAPGAPAKAEQGQSGGSAAPRQ